MKDGSVKWEYQFYEQSQVKSGIRKFDSRVFDNVEGVYLDQEFIYEAV